MLGSDHGMDKASYKSGTLHEHYILFRCYDERFFLYISLQKRDYTEKIGFTERITDQLFTLFNRRGYRQGSLQPQTNRSTSKLDD
jgi:hypothetical protein